MLPGSLLRQGGEFHDCVSAFLPEVHVMRGLGFPVRSSVKHTGEMPGPVTVRL